MVFGPWSKGLLLTRQRLTRKVSVAQLSVEKEWMEFTLLIGECGGAAVAFCKLRKALSCSEAPKKS